MGEVRGVKKVLSTRSSTTPSFSPPATLEQFLEWQLRSAVPKFYAELGLMPYRLEEIAKYLDKMVKGRRL